MASSINVQSCLQSCTIILFLPPCKILVFTYSPQSNWDLAVPGTFINQIPWLLATRLSADFPQPKSMGMLAQGCKSQMIKQGDCQMEEGTRECTGEAQ